MNKQKKTYVKPGIVFEDFRTGELRGTPEMIEKLSVTLLPVMADLNIKKEGSTNAIK